MSNPNNFYFVFLMEINGKQEIDRYETMDAAKKAAEIKFKNALLDKDRYTNQEAGICYSLVPTKDLEEALENDFKELVIS